MWRQVFPNICLFCAHQHAHARLVCDACQQQLPVVGHHCPQCAQSLATDALTCGQCLKAPPPFDRTLALFPYEPPIVQAIIKLKFSHQLVFADLFAQLMLSRLLNDWYPDENFPDLILPVPLHVKRLNDRGFNQAVEIAKPIAHVLNIPIDRHHTVRCKNTRAQSGLSADARRANLNQAFSTRRDYQGMKIAVLDDVITTGHTVRALAQVLRRHGAHTIHIWCCARRMRNSQ